jgi:transposase
MAYNFLACDRDQAFLLPPDLRDWLPADHLAWFVLDVVDQLDLHPFLAAYRADGHGRAAYEPRMLLGVLLYGYCTGVRSSRQIERRCHEDIAFRVLAGNSTPDHVTIARFRTRHQQALAGLLVASLRLCAAAGMVRLGLVALDGTKIEANAAAAANRTHAHLQAQVAELLSQAAEADRAEDHQHGPARGDELPRALAGRAERLVRLQHAKAQLEVEAPPASSATSNGSPSWPPLLGPAASDPEPTSDRDGAMRPLTPRRPPTPPTPTAASCVATAGPCRATTPRPPPPSGRSWSPPS